MVKEIRGGLHVHTPAYRYGMLHRTFRPTKLKFRQVVPLVFSGGKRRRV